MLASCGRSLLGRIKTKIKVQKEVLAGVTLQQTFVVEFVEQSKMCEDCHRSEASLTWTAVVQVRQGGPQAHVFVSRAAYIEA